MSETPPYRSRVRGCLLGGAIGDALGAPVEFQSLEQIRAEHGEEGVREYALAQFGDQHGYGLVTDDTQMTLFTAEGIIRASVRADRALGFTVGVVHHAYLRWLDTQRYPGPTGERDGWLQAEQWLYSKRAPGLTCLSALESPEGTGFGHPARNDSKGCGGVMRSAPFGLKMTPYDRRTAVFEMASIAASYTHGHPTGQAASGALALIIAILVDGHDLDEALDFTLSYLESVPGGAETHRALDAARSAAQQGDPSAHMVESLGGGWVAEEALAIAAYCALSFPRREQMLDALSLAVTHSGDSDSTGAICGNILGAWHGEDALPAELAFEVEGRGTILQIADDFTYEMTARDRLHGDYGPHTRWTDRYPGW